MNTIKILGTGCPTCKKVEELVKNVVDELQCDIIIEKVTDIEKIMEYDVMSTPAIVVDEKVVIKGRVPSRDEVRKLIENSCCSASDEACCQDAGEIIPSPCCGENKDTKKKDNCC